MKKKNTHKPIIETLINTAALTLTAYGVNVIVNLNSASGYIPIMFGMALEFFKYWGREKYW